MGLLSRFEDGLENVMEGAAGAVFKAPVEPAQIAKQAEKAMRREKLIGAGHQYAPTLYNVLLAPEDDQRLAGFYPTMAAEIETFLMGQADENGLDLVCRPLVRFIVDETLKQGRFEVVAENVAAEIVQQLREEEMELYGIAPNRGHQGYGQGGQGYEIQEPLENPYPDYPEAQPGRETATVMYGSDTPADQQGQPRLVNIATGDTYPLRSPMIIGREQGTDIKLPDSNVSRKHARIGVDAEGSWAIQDLGSTNGVKVNGQRVLQAKLRPGDRITLGMTVLDFRL